NGTRDASEVPLAGVKLTLWNEAGQKVGQTTTDSSGYYRFDNLVPGKYRVTEDQPAGYLPGKAAAGTVNSVRVGSTDSTGNVIAEIGLPSGVHGVDYDFGELVPASIAGRVIVDTNGNCIIDATGEMPLQGVVIELLDSNGSVLQTTHTDAGGFYRFENLMPGVYRVHEVQPAGYFQGDQEAGTGGGDDSVEDIISSIAVHSGDELTDYRFCEIPPADLSGYVFVDRDGDCLFDSEESPIAGTKVTLYDESGAVVGTATTDASGRYEFHNLRPGKYTVREEQPAGYFQGGQKAGSAGGNDSQADVISAIPIAAGASLVEYNFCEVPPAEISGYVFVDRDEDCLFDSGEAPIAGTKVTLYDSSGAVVGTATTDASGHYQFRNLRPGTYTIREEQPAGYLQGGQKAGSAGGNDSQADVISAIPIAAGATLINYNFCEVKPASISGQVFVDLNFDCVRDENEQLLSGVKVELLDSTGQVIATTLTDASGQYRFVGLRPGTYSVRETQPDGYFQGGQKAPATGGDDSVDDLISGMRLQSGDAVHDANFCEVPPATISGYVFQDGPAIVTSNINDIDLNSVRDGRRTSDDKPIGRVRLQLRTIAGAPIDSSRALNGVYTTEYIEVETDENGYFEFQGLRAGTYNIYQLQPVGYIDGIDTAGTTGGYSVNKGQTQTSEQFELLMQSLTMDAATDPHFDGILLVSVEPNQHSFENNFSEVITTPPPKPPLPPPPMDKPPAPPPKVIVTPDVWAAPPPLVWKPMPWAPPEPLIGVGYQAPPTWHLSVINAGYPRGRRNGDPVDQSQVADKAELLDVNAWQVRGLKESRWTIVSTAQTKPASSRTTFDIPEATPVAGDFNGDGFDELALFVEGEWFIDLNGNGIWDDNDIWLKLGDKTDQPVVGDWDGDGKDDVGVFGKTWTGDERALAVEPGLPDPENMRRIKPKNLPPTPEEAPDEPRWLQHSNAGPARADLIDHVFRFGSEKDIAITGDFNGDGISSIGVFQEGKWTLDVDGDGVLSPDRDRIIEFGETGDLPLIGDFDGNGIDELAIVRGNQVIVDSNGNGRIDATDQVFQLENEAGTVVVGDFDGDGKDEPALHQSVGQRRTLSARR
ncbi:MAG: SdrD B-like domain-containing protein, partial [Aureliella sp.]